MLKKYNLVPSIYTHRETTVPWTHWDATFGLSLIALFLMGSIFVSAVWRNHDGMTTPIFLTFALMIMPGIMIFVAWRLSIKRYKVSWATLGFRSPHGRFSLMFSIAALLLSIGFGIVYVRVTTMIGIDLLIPPNFQKTYLGEMPLEFANLITIIILGPLGEEVFYRAFLLGALIKSTGTIRAIAISSIIFAVSHISLGVILPFFISGVLLSFLYIRTKSIWPPLVAHSMQNLLAVITIYLSPI